MSAPPDVVRDAPVSLLAMLVIRYVPPGGDREAGLAACRQIEDTLAALAPGDATGIRAVALEILRRESRNERYSQTEADEIRAAYDALAALTPDVVAAVTTIAQRRVDEIERDESRERVLRWEAPERVERRAEHNTLRATLAALARLPGGGGGA